MFCHIWLGFGAAGATTAVVCYQCPSGSFSTAAGLLYLQSSLAALESIPVSINWSHSFCRYLYSGSLVTMRY